MSGPNYRIQFIVNEPIAEQVRSTTNEIVNEPTTGIDFLIKEIYIIIMGSMLKQFLLVMKLR